MLSTRVILLFLVLGVVAVLSTPAESKYLNYTLHVIHISRNRYSGETRITRCSWEPAQQR